VIRSVGVTNQLTDHVIELKSDRAQKIVTEPVTSRRRAFDSAGIPAAKDN